MLSAGRSPLSSRWPVLAICIVATIVGIGLQVLRLLHAGGLWRDEAGGVALSTLPGIGEVWQMLTHDSFPIAFPAVIHFWTLCFGDSDLGFRILGFLIDSSVLVALWWNARLMGYHLPVISLSLLAGNFMFIVWGSEMRAYGCAALFTILTFGLVWKFVVERGRLSFFLAMVTAVLSAQSLYQDAFLILAICIAGSVVCAQRGEWKMAARTLCVGLPAAISLIPYVPKLIEAQQLFVLTKMGFNAAREWGIFNAALTFPVYPLRWLWFGLALLAVLTSIVAWRKLSRTPPVSSADLPVFAGVTLVLGTVGFFVFRALTQMPPQPWYYVSLATLAAPAMDAILAGYCRRLPKTTAALLAVLGIALPMPMVVRYLKCPQTNIDRIADELRTRAAPEDYIVVRHWYCGLSFQRYYHGQTPWTTLPPMEDLRFHRLDQIMDRYLDGSLLTNVLAAAGRTLSSGHSVWIIDDARVARPQFRGLQLPERNTFNGEHPVDFSTYDLCQGIWEQRLEQLIRGPGVTVTCVLPRADVANTTYESENLSLNKAFIPRDESAPAPGGQP